MKFYKNISIRKKIMISTLVFTVVPILIVILVALSITYTTMKDQLIYNHRMSSGWLQDRLSIETKEILNTFYDLEVDKDIKSDILDWCRTDGKLGYEARWRIITRLNSAININSSINSIELFNLSDDTVLVAERSGASLTTTGTRLDFWRTRNSSLQSNLVFFRDENEILAAHQVHRFEDNTPVAVYVIHFRHYFLEDILSEIKTVSEETIVLFNDQGDLIETDYGSGSDFTSEYLREISDRLAESDTKELLLDDQFWFYRQVNSGKLQILLTVPNATIVQALFPTLLSGIIVSLLAVFASVLCSVLYSRSISQPIQMLSGKVKSLTLSEFAGAFSEDRQDEIGLLQTSFDYMVKRNQELIAQQYQSKLEKRNAQLHALQAQINPHFMYNTLQVIGGMSLEKNASEIYDITVALSDIMRYSLNFSKDMVPLSEEIHYLESYIMIQNERFTGKIHLEAVLSPNTMKCYIPKLILQPLVENSFEHGLTDRSGEWYISVTSCITEDNDLLICVKDNGIGMDEQHLDELQRSLMTGTANTLKLSSHIGLRNVHERIRLCCQDDRYGIHIQSTPEDGTAVSIYMKIFWEAKGEKYV